MSANLLSATGAGNERIWIHDGFSTTILSSFAWANSASGLALDAEKNLLSCSDVMNMIYKHQGISATILDSFASPHQHPTGLAFDPLTGNLISCNLVNGTGIRKIYIHDGVSSTILDSWDTVGTRPQGLALDNDGNLIYCDTDTNKIYKYIGISNVVDYSFATPGTNPGALTFLNEEANLISCESGFLPGERLIYRHDGISAVLLETIVSPDPFVCPVWGLDWYEPPPSEQEVFGGYIG